MRGIPALLIGAMLLALCGCSDDTVNNYYRSDTGAIYGNVLPVDSGVVRAIGGQIFETPLTSAGTFRLSDLPPGIYEVQVIPQNHTMRVFRDVTVESGKSQGLMRITISSLPYPVFKTSPANGAVDASSSQIVLYVDEYLNLSDLNTATHISPAVDQSPWISSSYYYGYDYESDYMSYPICYTNVSRQGKSGFQVGTEYQVTIDSTVRTISGTPLGKTLRFSFRSQSLSVQVFLPRYSLTGLVSLSSFSPSLKFSTCVNPDSVNKALRFEPPIEGVWMSSQGNDYGRTCSDLPNNYFYRFFQTGAAPLASTNYRLIVDDVTKLVDEVSFEIPDTTEFLTDAYGVEYVSPVQGAYHVVADQQILLTFNALMDTLSVQATFKLERYGGEAVSGEFAWTLPGRKLTFSHPGQLLVSQGVYRITVLKGAKTAAGSELEKDFVSYFAVE